MQAWCRIAVALALLAPAGSAASAEECRASAAHVAAWNSIERNPAPLQVGIACAFQKPCRLVDPQGRLVGDVGDWMEGEPYSEGLLPMRFGTEIGYVDAAGQWAVRPRFVEAGPFCDGLAPAHDEDVRWGYIDRTGAFVIPRRFGDAGPFTEGLAPVREPGARPSDRKTGYIDRTGNYVIPPRFEAGALFSEGLAAVRERGAWGYIDRTGRFVVPPRFEEAAAFRDGHALVTRRGRLGLIDRTGRIVVEPLYSDATRDGGLIDFVLRKGDLDGPHTDTHRIARADGSWLTPETYDRVGALDRALIAVCKGRTCGYIDRDGRVAIPFGFAQAGDFAEGLAPVKIGRKIGYIDRSGKVAIEARFDEGRHAADDWAAGEYSFSEGVAAAGCGKRRGFIDTEGRWTAPPTFDGLHRVASGLSQAWLGRSTGYVTRDGRPVDFDPKPAGKAADRIDLCRAPLAPGVSASATP